MKDISLLLPLLPPRTTTTIALLPASSIGNRHNMVEYLQYRFFIDTLLNTNPNSHPRPYQREMKLKRGDEKK